MVPMGHSMTEARPIRGHPNLETSPQMNQCCCFLYSTCYFLYSTCCCPCWTCYFLYWTCLKNSSNSWIPCQTFQKKKTSHRRELLPTPNVRGCVHPTSRACPNPHCHCFRSCRICHCHSCQTCHFHCHSSQTCHFHCRSFRIFPKSQRIHSNPSSRHRTNRRRTKHRRGRRQSNRHRGRRQTSLRSFRCFHCSHSFQTCRCHFHCHSCRSCRKSLMIQKNQTTGRPKNHPTSRRHPIVTVFERAQPQ
mmetsp:Transcript_10489/g.21741  ORF Transcript_10489/g.21741 Transcript_10489/m.21741 type:complete len:247 (-) Transcript_10489:308-1048(-)